MYIGDWMERGTRYWPEHEALYDVASGARYTYAQLNDRANRVAAWLRSEAGVVKGDRIALLAMNSVAYLDVFFACGKLGAIFVPYNWRLHGRELAQITAAVAPRALLFDGDLVALAEATLTGGDAVVEEVIHLDGAGIPGSIPYEEVVGYGDAGPAPAITEASVVDSDTCCLLFTGGTTGLPKAAEISYRMVAWNTLNTVIHELDRGDCTVTHTPMFHTGALLVYTLPLLTLGGKVVLMRKWDAEGMLALVEAEGVTMFFAVPTQYQMMAECPRFASTDLSKIRFLTSGGAPLPVPLIEVWQRAHGVPFKQGFGMTEFGPGVMSMGAEFAVTKAGSIGRPNFFVDARLDGGNPGELCLKGPSMFSGYFRNPKATAEAIDSEGWFHTGDVARVDEDGFYYIVDRKKDMFISGGENVYPAEIEQILYQHPSVAQCAVVGIPHEKWGEVGRVHVVLKKGAEASEEALLAFLKERLARYKVPKAVVFMDALPVSAAGKILKRELREL